MLTYVRTTITIPPALKARMEAHEPPFNWSSVACRAFEMIVGVDNVVIDGPEHDMTVIAPAEDHGPGVRLLDREDAINLQRNLDAGRVVAIYDGATGMNVVYVLCVNAAEMLKVFAAYDDPAGYAIKDE